MTAPSSVLATLVTVAGERHFDMTQLVSGLPDGALHWRPAPQAASMAGLALHIFDVTGGVLAVAAGELPSWSGPNGSRMDERASEQQLVADIRELDERFARVVSALPPSAFEARLEGDERTVVQTLLEEMDHVAMHYGQLQLTRHLWEAAHPQWPSDYVHWR